MFNKTCSKCGSSSPMMRFIKDGPNEKIKCTCCCGHTWDTPTKDSGIKTEGTSGNSPTLLNE